MATDRLTRRTFLRASLAGFATLSGARPFGQTLAGPPLDPYIADIDGDGRLTEADVNLIQQVFLTSRGFALRPNEGFDFRADVFGRGAIDQQAVDAVLQTIAQVGYGTLDAPRPITVAWHYGWHDTLQRPLLQQTTRYLEGDYLSNDPRVEEGFNELKNEVGITVDALGWIPPRVTPTILPNLRKGYFSTKNAATRYVALLYENTLSLPMTAGRIDFRSSEVRTLLVDDFAAMAAMLVEARDRYATRVFLLQSRPVVFIFGSHSWGLNPADETEFQNMAETVRNSREAFRAIYGEFPYLVGEELLQLASTATPSPDRIHRAINFDALYAYHCANLKPTARTFPITKAYAFLQQHRLERAAAGVRRLRNRFHGNRILLIPSLAGGFAKHGLPILDTTGRAYTNFLQQLTRYYTGTYLRNEWPTAVGSNALPAPVYTVGSWNEEFEGHAVFPAQFNLALRNSRFNGFDFAMALKQVFGWNHYAQRDIPT